MKQFIMGILAIVAGSAFGAVNDHLACRATEFFGRLNVEVHHQADVVQVHLQGLDAGRAALSLGLVAAGAGVEALELDFPKSWCVVSDTTVGVIHCEVPSATFPAPTLSARAVARDGSELGTGVLSVADVSLESTRRISATSAGDLERHFVELSAFLISNTDNQKRANLSLPYADGDCRSL